MLLVDDEADVRAATQRTLQRAGAEVTVIGPDEEYLAGPGASPLDPDGRPAAAEAGRRFARRRP